MQPDYKSLELSIISSNLKQLEEARKICHARLGKIPNDVVCLHLMGMIEYRLGHAALASELFEKALKLNPSSPGLYYEYAKSQAAQKKIPEAMNAFKRAVELKPDFAEAYYRLGNLYLSCNNDSKAIEAYNNALAINPNYPEALNNLGIVYKNKGVLAAASKCYYRALQVKPDYPAALNNLGMILCLLGEFAESIKLYKQALTIQPQYPEALNNLGVALRSSGQLKQAITAFEQAIVLIKDKPEFHKNLAMALLADGRLQEGWQEYEWRWQTPQFAHILQGMSKPRWQGQQSEGATLLIRAEQGFGDMLQFCRYVPQAAARGLRVILEVQPGLVRLMESLAGVDQVIPVGQPLPDHDFYCPVMSLPTAFNTRLETVPTKVPYLAATAADVNYWRTRLQERDEKKFKVGLVWAGNPRSNIIAFAAADRRRSIDPALLVPLKDLADIQFYSLQKSGPSAPKELGLIDLMGECHDFADTAALITNLDLVISVDTAVAHLAGALGKPVWVLNRYDSCWRWLPQREDTPWYPTMRLFWQQQPKDWTSVVSRIKNELNQLFI